MPGHEDSFSKMQSLELPQRVDWSATRNSLPILDEGVDAETEAYSNIRSAYLRMDEWITCSTNPSYSSGAWSHAESAFSDNFALTNHTQLTFTLPPFRGAVFHLRFRQRVDERVIPNVLGQDHGWENPLMWSGGDFFGPKLKGPRGRVCLPPPVLLSQDWEAEHIEKRWKWQEQLFDPREGELRLFTLCGLEPSVDTQSSWSGWFTSKAGQGLYGKRVVEIEYCALHIRGNEMPDWETTCLEGIWRPVTRYNIPSSDIGTFVLIRAMNFMSTDGIQWLQRSLEDELGQKHRKQNMRMIKAFFADMYNKMLPLWHASVEPLLANNPTLQLLVAEKRTEKARAVLLRLLEVLQKRQLATSIPQRLIPDRPTIRRLVITIGGAEVDVQPGRWNEIEEGEAFTLRCEARRSALHEGLHRPVKVWWMIRGSSWKNEAGLELHNLTEGKIVRRNIQLRPQETTDEAGLFSSTLHIKGRSIYKNILIEKGSELIFRAIVEEREAQEDAYDEILVRIVEPVAAGGRRAISDAATVTLAAPRNPEAPYRRSAPPVFGRSISDDVVMRAFESACKSVGAADARSVVNLALLELGHRPHEEDLDAAVDELGASIIDARRFNEWYKISPFGDSLAGFAWQQLEQTLQSYRNDFLLHRLEIPVEKWGFAEDQWGGVIPEANVMREHMLSVCKRSLHKVWVERDQQQAGSEADSRPSAAPAAALQLDMDSAQEVEAAKLVQVLEALAVNFAKYYLAKLLPDDSEHDASVAAERRKKFVDNAIKCANLQQTFSQLTKLQLAAQYKEFKKSAQRRKLNRAAFAAAAEKREIEILRWLDDPYAQPTADPSPIEIGTVVAKSMIKHELEELLDTQLVPMVIDALKTKLLPAAQELLVELAREFVAKHKWKLLLSGLTITGAAAAVVIRLFGYRHPRA